MEEWIYVLGFILFILVLGPPLAHLWVRYIEWTTKKFGGK